MNETLKEYISPGKKNIILIYLLYFMGSFIEILPIIGAIFAFIGIEQKDNFLKSHYLFAFRTFCIGIIGAIATLISIGTIATFISMFVFVGFILYIVLLVWFIMRAIIALKYLLNDQEHPNPLGYGIQ